MSGNVIISRESLDLQVFVSPDRRGGFICWWNARLASGAGAYWYRRFRKLERAIAAFHSRALEARVLEDARNHGREV